MRSALKTMKERKTIEKLQARLTDCQTKYHLALTTEMRDEVLRLLEQQGKNTESMRDIILQRLKKASSESAASHSTTHGKLHALGEDLNQSALTVQKKLSALRISQQSSGKTLRTGQRSLGKNIDRQFQKQSTSDTHQKFLDILHFPEMFARQESIKRRSPGTYDWVFDDELTGSDDKDTELRGRISRWLRNPDGNTLFWIQGKPGSGKSSLISFIMGDPRTKECMRVWAGGRDPYIFNFFFWKPGSSLQKTMLGLRRSLLWQLCKAKPVIIEKLLSQDPTLLYSPCTEEKLVVALDLALSYYRDESVLFLIDGLDECEGNHNDLLDELHGTRFGQRNKICLSSRPEEALRRRLEPLLSVRLQDLNYEDILKYAHKKLQIGGSSGLKLASRVAENAEGVFLWAVLVCDSLSSGVIVKDSEENMLRRLHAYPKGLDELFHRMFSNVEEIHYKSVALYFYAARQRSFSVAMAAASQQPRKIMTIARFGELCELEMTRITAQSKGLLQIEDSIDWISRKKVWTHGWTLRDISNNHIRKGPLECGGIRIFKKYVNTNIAFVHRSAYDYIFDVANNELPAWLRPIGGPEMIHDILDGVLWLAEYQPVVVAVPETGTCEHTAFETALTLYTLEPQFQAIATVDFSKLDQQRLYDHLDKHLDAIHGWTSLQRSYPTGTFSKCVASDRLATHTPWTSFWLGVMQIEPSFLTSRMHRFWDCDDPFFETLVLLGTIGPTLDGESLPIEICHAFRERPNSSIADFPYTGQRRYCSLAPTNRHLVYSWLGTGIKRERLIARYLYIAAANTSRYDISELESHSHAYVLSDICTRVHAISDTWQLFIGTLACIPRGSEASSPLQLSLPLYYVRPPDLLYLADDDASEATMNKLSFRRPELTLRLSCFAKRGPHRLVEEYYEMADLMGSISATATYHLSSQTTAIVVAHKPGEKSRFRADFVGTIAERSTCIDVILTDLWDDVDSQLTAWEQLYARACVKCYFAWFWEEEEYSPNV
jgi:hypothetical protein